MARELLSETGSVFVQIGDENVHLVRCLMDEVFGSENFVSQVSFRTKIPLNPVYIANIADHLAWYSKSKSEAKFRRVYRSRDTGDDSAYSPITTQVGEERIGTLVDLMASGYTESCHFEFLHEGRRAYPPGRNSWKTTPVGIRRLILAGRVQWMKAVPRFRSYSDDYPVTEFTNQWTDTQGAAGKVYAVQTANKVVERCILMTTDPGDLVLDPTCGSGTTAYVAEQWGRRWITIDTSRVALALARTRLMAAKFPYYLLADSKEGIEKEAEVTGRLPQETKTSNDIRKGFVYRRVPHVTIGSVAHNEEIDVIHAKWQEKLEPLRKELNKALRHRWEEWEVPREAEKSWPAEARKLHAEWWKLRRERQKEIDASIAKHADTELLYDQPYEDAKRIRVTGPFTVESLSPHRVLATDEERPKAESQQIKAASGQFETMIVENLKKAGVKSTDKKFRIAFDRLEPFAGTWLHATGEFTEAETGKSKRIAVSIGPEHGTVGPEQVKEAAKEAVLGVGFDVLVVCGFAFDPHVREETRRYGETGTRYGTRPGYGGER